MDFTQAQAGYQWLDSQLKCGAIDEQRYQSGLNELRVTDPWGRLWMMQAHTGVWHVFNNGAWVAAQPPVTSPAPMPPPPPAPPVAAAAPYAAPVIAPIKPVKPEPPLLAKYLRMLVIWVVIWVVIAVGFYLFWGQSHMDEFFPGVLLGIGAAALLSLFLMLRSLSSSWKGQVVDVRVEREATNDDDGVSYENVRFAYIRTTAGKMRRERAMNNWQVGDWLEKKQGEGWVRKL